jgi:hypothetical protein
MNSDQIAVILKRFEAPDEVRVLEERAIRASASRRHDHWARHIRAGLEVERARRPECGRQPLPGRARWLVLSGTATAAFDDGRIFELRAGELFYIPPVPHDSWVVGELPYVSLHFLGAEQYATPKS